MIPMGFITDEYGEVIAVGWVGERCYWLIRDGVISMIPASVIEPLYAKPPK